MSSGYRFHEFSGLHCLLHWINQQAEATVLLCERNSDSANQMTVDICAGFTGSGATFTAGTDFTLRAEVPAPTASRLAAESYIQLKA